MALYHKWDVKNDLTFVLQLFSLISDGLGVVAVICYDFFGDPIGLAGLTYSGTPQLPLG